MSSTSVNPRRDPRQKPIEQDYHTLGQKQTRPHPPHPPSLLAEDCVGRLHPRGLLVETHARPARPPSLPLENLVSLLENRGSLPESLASLLDGLVSPLENLGSHFENLASQLEGLVPLLETLVPPLETRASLLEYLASRRESPSSPLLGSVPPARRHGRLEDAASPRRRRLARQRRRHAFPGDVRALPRISGGECDARPGPRWSSSRASSKEPRRSTWTRRFKRPTGGRSSRRRRVYGWKAWRRGTCVTLRCPSTRPRRRAPRRRATARARRRP